MRIAFLGTDPFAVPVLEVLIASAHQVAVVVTGPDKPAGRGRKLRPTPVKERAVAAGIPVMTPPGPRDPRFIQEFQSLGMDAAVVVAYRILPPEIFDAPRLGTLNIHPSLLPKYRGPAPIQWALINGETETGVSIIRITETVDAGGVVLQARVTVDPDENAGQLAERLAPLGGEMVLEALAGLEAGTLTPLAQNESEVSRAPKLTKEDGFIDWNQTARAVHNRIRGVTPWPGAYTYLPDGKSLKLFESRDEFSNEGASAGEVIRIIKDQDYLKVACGEGAVRFLKVQLEGKRRMPVSEFLRGYDLSPGTCLGQR
ncbi:MAG: methionyl-tRNA formyltransferase [bacterium]